MDYIDLKQEVQRDINRYRRMIEMYRSGAKSGDVDSRGHVADRTAEMIGYLEGVISNLEKLLKAGGTG